ncbi:polysaccharide lyase [Actinomycetospora lutea]|uniref:polysaccharide lyase n=1 Tax=Actinomycetospora lutea TaxID=663604 RepID=UPI00236708B2|nr:polysaccharide lyase [Actinomycetospora lutea]MDD7940801.1 polysaccharide lyase [Actinomycetospora lutea]
MRSRPAVPPLTTRGWLAGLVGSLVVLALVLGVIAAVPAAASPASSPSPSSDRPLWSLPESGDLLSAFSRNDYDEQDGSPQQVTSPDDPARQAVQFTVPGGAQRSEMRPRVPDQTEGTTQYYTYVAKLPDEFPAEVDTWQLLLQWHQYGDSGSPPVAVEIRDNRLMLAAEGGDLQDLGPVAAGDRIDLTMRIAFSRDPDQGSVDVWRDGSPVLQGYRPPSGTLLDGGNYMKVGLYRDTSVSETGRVWLEDLRVGSSLASVQSSISASNRIPSESDPANNPSAPGGGSSTETLTWVAAGLLVVVAALAVLSLRRRRTHG